MTNTVDERCDLLDEAKKVAHDENAFAEKLKRVIGIDTLRVDRLLLASLKDDEDGREAVFKQMPSCPSCYQGLVIHAVGRLAARQEEAHDDDTAAAIAAVEAMIVEDMDGGSA